MKEELEEDSDKTSSVQSSTFPKKKTKAKNNTFKCKTCKNVYQKDSFDAHMATHAGKPAHKCHICQNEYSKRNYLLRHIRNIHTDKRHQLKCSVCDRTFAYESKRKEHEMVHTGEKPHKCEVCGKSFRAQYCYNMHMLMHSDEKPFKCAHCPYACRDTSTLRKHQALHTGQSAIYQCTKCDKKYKAKWRLKTHIAEEHLGLNVRLTACGRCDRKFKSRSALSSHVRIVHERAKLDKCEICGKYLTNSSNMMAHLRTHSSLKPFACTEEGCAMCFRTKADAKKHSVTHHPRRKTPCLQCGRRFARVSALRRHELTQHRPKVKATECEICGVMFYNDNYLLKHLHQKHSSFKERYECDHCGLVTMNKPSIVMHLKYTHGNEKDLKCTICKRKYKKHVYLKMHYLKSHNLRYKPIQRKRVLPELEVSVKEEPLDIVDHDLEGALENAEIVNAEDMTFHSESRESPAEATELSESAANALIADNVASLTSLPERVFDEFFIRHLKHDTGDKETLEIQPKKDLEELELKRAQEEREKQIVKARENAIQECLENARKACNEGVGPKTVEAENTIAVSGNTTAVSGNTTVVSGNTTAVSGNTTVVFGNTTVVSGNTIAVSGNEANKTVGLGRKQKSLYRKRELLLPCEVCGKECRGLAAFKEHSKGHRNFFNKTKQCTSSQQVKGHSKNQKTKEYRSSEQAKELHSKNNNKTKQYLASSDYVRGGNEKRNNRLKDVRGSEAAKAGLPKRSRRDQVHNLKEFYNENVKDLGIEFEKFVEICKKVKKDQ